MSNSRAKGLKENLEPFLVASKEVGPGMFISHKNNAGQNHNIQEINKTFENVAKIIWEGGEFYTAYSGN